MISKSRLFWVAQILVLASFLGCQIEDGDAPEPDEFFQKIYGVNGFSEETKGLIYNNENNEVVLYGTQSVGNQFGLYMV